MRFSGSVAPPGSVTSRRCGSHSRSRPRPRCRGPRVPQWRCSTPKHLGRITWEEPSEKWGTTWQKLWFYHISPAEMVIWLMEMVTSPAGVIQDTPWRPVHTPNPPNATAGSEASRSRQICQVCQWLEGSRPLANSYLRKSWGRSSTKPIQSHRNPIKSHDMSHEIQYSIHFNNCLSIKSRDDEVVMRTWWGKWMNMMYHSVSSSEAQFIDHIPSYSIIF